MTIKLKKKDNPHRLHYFVVDRSNMFSICSHCGLMRNRKKVGWETREEKI
jgi:hypothetical protein